nr:MAG TPA: hypothetical protein [Caudoviricetes sp.]
MGKSCVVIGTSNMLPTSMSVTFPKTASQAIS